MLTTDSSSHILSSQLLLSFTYSTCFSSVVSAFLSPLTTYFYVNKATNILCSILISCLDIICPLNSRPTHATPTCTPGLQMLSMTIERSSELLRANDARLTWKKYHSPLSSFSSSISAAYSQNRISNTSDTLRLDFRTFFSSPLHLLWLLLWLLMTSPATSLKIWQPSATSSLHHSPTGDLHPHTFNYSLCCFPLWRVWSPRFSVPAIQQLVP